MSAHPSAANLQRHGCRLFSIVALGNKTSQDKFIVDEAVQVVLRAMAEHSTVSSVQAQGCTALSSLAAHSRDTTFSEQAIKAVLKGLGDYLPVAAVQENGC